MSRERDLLQTALGILEDYEWGYGGDHHKSPEASILNDIRKLLAQPELLEEVHQEHNKPRCCICKTTENVKYVGGYQAYRCPSPDCVPF